MSRFWDRWEASAGDKITGVIFYFENRDGSYSAIVRTPERFFVLPSESADAFLVGRPPEGSEVEVERSGTGYKLRILPKAAHTSAE